MKIRKGFVSNSSSSSFVCEVCGAVESGYDASPGDCGFCVCENDHTFCIDHLLPAPTKPETPAKDTTDDEEYDEEDYEEGGDDVPASRCPICQLAAVSSSDLATYLLSKSGKTETEVVTSIKQAFKTREAFDEFLRGVQ